MKKIKVLFFINTLAGGGAEKVLIDIVNNMDKSCFDITVQTVLDGGVHKEALASDVNYKTIIKTKNTYLKKIFNYFINFIIPPKAVYKRFIESGYDYEVAFLEGIPTKILAEGKNKNTKKYAWIHTDLFNNFQGHEKIFKNFNRYIDCYKKYDKIICVSEGVREGFEKRFGLRNNICLVYNPYDENKIKALAEEKQGEIKENEFNIVSVGRLCKPKGYKRLLEIHKQLIDEGLLHNLYILGEGQDREELEKYIKDNSLEKTITLLGFKANPYKYVKACDLFVCSSFVEGFSTAIAEAIILSVPVVSTDCPGVIEILGNSQYGIVTENNKEALYQGLKSVLSDKQKYEHYKEKCYERSEFFKLENSIRRIEKIFGED